jgi:hypothetical protein
MQNYTRYAAERGLRLSNSRAVCVHAVLGARCPDFYAVCGTDAPRPFVRIFDHRVLYRLGNDKVLLTEPYADVEQATESARVIAAVLDLCYAVGEPGSGPYAAGVNAGSAGGPLRSPVPIAFALSQALADLAVSHPEQ